MRSGESTSPLEGRSFFFVFSSHVPSLYAARCISRQLDWACHRLGKYLALLAVWGIISNHHWQ